MADPAIVQSVLVGGDGLGGNVASFASLPTVGNYVVVAAASGDAATPSSTVTDNQGHTYTRQATSSDSSSQTVELWYTKVTTSAGTFTVTVGNMGSSATGATIMEASNVHASSPILDSGGRGVTGFTETLCLSKALASPQINALLIEACVFGAQGHTYVYRGDLAQVRDSNSIGTGVDKPHAVGAGKLTAHGGNVVATIQINAADSYNSVAMILRGTDPAVTGPGGGAADDRYRFRPSTFWSGTSTLGTKRSAWPDDAFDGGQRDSLADNFSRMN